MGIKALGISANVGLEDPNAPDAGQDSVITGASKRASEAPAEAEAAGADEQSPGAVKKTEESAFGWKELLVTVLVAVAFAVGLFVVVPLFVVKYFEETFSNPFVFNLVEGVIRIVIFLLYIVVISFLPDLRRVFMYHGAEHKVIHAYESCGRPDAEQAKALLDPAPALRHRVSAPRDGHRCVRLRHRGQARPALVGALAPPGHPAHHRRLIRNRHKMGG